MSKGHRDLRDDLFAIVGDSSKVDVALERIRRDDVVERINGLALDGLTCDCAERQFTCRETIGIQHALHAMRAVLR